MLLSQLSPTRSEAMAKLQAMMPAADGGSGAAESTAKISVPRAAELARSRLQALRFSAPAAASTGGSAAALSATTSAPAPEFESFFQRAMAISETAPPRFLLPVASPVAPPLMLYRVLHSASDPPPRLFTSVGSTWNFEAWDATRQRTHEEWEREAVPTRPSKTMPMRELVPTEPLTAQEQAVIASLNQGPDTEPVGSFTKHDFRTLNHRQWLNDEAINGYAKLVEARVKGDDRPYVFISFFFSTLQGDPPAYHFDKVKRWTARGLGKADLFARRAVFFPINVGNTHWTLVVADMRKRTLTYYDSLGGAGTACLELIERYLKDEYEEKKGEPHPFAWTLVSAGRSTPQQDNGVDCGVFSVALLNVLHRAFELDVEPDLAGTFAQSDIARIRQQIQLDLVRGKVFPL